MSAADHGIGGGIGVAQNGAPGHVSFYVEVDDPAAYLSKAETLGGQTVVPPTEIPQFGLTFAFFTDPEGHLIGLSRGAVQPGLRWDEPDEPVRTTLAAGPGPAVD